MVVFCPMRTLLILLMLPLLASAQKPTMDYKKYTGRYGNSSGICLFDDGRFLMYGYATAVFGDYKIKDVILEFYPDKMDLFEVYGHQNKSLAKGMRVNFKGFDRGGQSFVDFGGVGHKRVFNEGANCFDGPFVYESASLPKQITLTSSASPASFEIPRDGESWTFDNKVGYNDFIFVFNSLKREYEDFRGKFLMRAGHRTLQLSNYGGEEGYILNPSPDEQWGEIMDWKKQYDSSQKMELNVAYANLHYSIFSEAVLTDYKLDAAKNLYIKKPGNNNDEEYFRDNEYKDDRELRKYVKLEASRKEKAIVKKPLDGSIFFTVCGEGSERSYHYKGYRYKDLDDGNVQKATKLDTIPAIVVPPPPPPSKKE